MESWLQIPSYTYRTVDPEQRMTTTFASPITVDPAEAASFRSVFPAVGVTGFSAATLELALIRLFSVVLF